MAKRLGRAAAPLNSNAEERACWERQVRRLQVFRSFSDRCRIILGCADGMPSKAVAAELGWRDVYPTPSTAPQHQRPGSIRSNVGLWRSPARKSSAASIDRFANSKSTSRRSSTPITKTQSPIAGSSRPTKSSRRSNASVKKTKRYHGANFRSR